jgi:hypothetical protein
MIVKNLRILFLIQILSFQKVVAQTVYYDNESKLYGIIDRSGKNILKPTFDEMTMFEKGLSRFKENNKWGLINEKGIVIISPEFETVYDFCVQGFNDGLISVRKDGKYGYYSEKGDLIIEHKFDWTGQFCEGIAWVKVSEEYSFINLEGECITDKWFDDVKIVEGVTYGIDKKRRYDVHGKSYYTQGEAIFYQIDKNGMVSLAENQKYISDYKSNYVAYCDKFKKNPPTISASFDWQNGWRYKNNNNEFIGADAYALTSDFEDGVAFVIKFGNKNNNSNRVMAIVNEKLEIIEELDEKFEPIYGSEVKFQNGLIEFRYLVSKPDDEIQKWEYVLIDKKGEVIKIMNEGVFPVPSGG